jgi:hypothetical protein
MHTAEEIATYLKLLFTSQLKGNNEKISMPDFSIDLLEECHYAVRLLVEAVKNPSKWP